MANRVVRVENKVLVGVGGLTINTCLFCKQENSAFSEHT